MKNYSKPMVKLFDIKVEESIAICNSWLYTSGQYPCDDNPLNGGDDKRCWQYASNPANS